VRGEANTGFCRCRRGVEGGVAVLLLLGWERSDRGRGGAGDDEGATQRRQRRGVRVFDLEGCDAEVYARVGAMGGIDPTHRINCEAEGGRRGGLTGWSGWQIHGRTHGTAEKAVTDFCHHFILFKSRDRDRDFFSQPKSTVQITKQLL
jgi:hypothetical protein